MRRNVAILVFNEIEVLDFAGPFEVFAVTDQLRDRAAFSVSIVSPAGDAVRARNGLKVTPEHSFADCPQPQVLVVPGGFGTRALLGNEVVINWILERSRASEVTMSVCTGSLSAGIDCSLHLVGRLLGDDVAAATAAYMEYERRG
jgi:transcriptional regulator GlxA family with amidase domain